MPEFHRAIEVFCSYAHEDELYRRQLEAHLSVLKQQGLMLLWHDQQILPGTNRAEAIDAHLSAASIILLLISADFLASDFCDTTEMQHALERHKHGEISVIPIILRPCDWQNAPFRDLQCLPSRIPVTKWDNQDEAFTEIAEGIRRIIEGYFGVSVVTPRVPLQPRPASFLAHTSLSRHFSVEEQNRERLIWRVRSFWVEGVFKRSLHDAMLMMLELHELPEAIANPWQLVIQESEHTNTPLPAGTRITEVYDDAHGELLILGSPGAGKTTLLLELARDLLSRAEQEQAHPIPVVFNLSSWTRRQPLATWLIEELETKYQVPRKFGSGWINADQILPLLDGLDEVDVASRTTCMQAINEYRRAHSLVPLVVCCRVNEYMSQENRLALFRAITIQPLTTEQINEYFERIGEQIASLRVAFQNDQILQELATTPLMLTILILAYQGSSLQEIEGAVSAEARKRQIFTTYTQRVLGRRSARSCYSPQQTVHWLSYLAWQMKQQNQTIFYIERMQPNWSIRGWMSWIYESLAIRFPDVLVGITVALLIITMLFVRIWGVTFELCYCSVGGLVSGFLGRGKRISSLTEGSSVHAQRSLWKSIIDIRYLGNGLLLGLIYGLTYGSAYGLRIGLVYGSIFGLVGILLSSIFNQDMFKRPFEENVGQPRENRWYELINFGYLRIALGVGLSYGLGYGLSTEITNQLHISQRSVLANMLFYMLAYILIGILICLILERRKRVIEPAEMIIWSWRTLWGNLITIRYWRNGLFVGLLVGSIIGLSIGLREEQPTTGIFFGVNAALIFGVGYWLLLIILKALSSEMIDEHQHIKPNEGTWYSVRNSLVIGFVSGCISWLVCSLSYTASYTFIYNFSTGMSIGLFIARNIGLLVGLSVGLLCGLLNGGIAFLQHWTLRLLLWYAGFIPWSYPRFLDYAAERILLRKVGGGYIFIHQELLEYFASLAKIVYNK